MGRLLNKALSAKRRSKYVEFRAGFDIGSSRDWCELLRDLAAMANSGGGVVLIGVDADGRPANSDVSTILGMDPVMVADKMHHYTDSPFADFHILEALKDGVKLAAIEVGAAFPPVVFTKTGGYTDDELWEKTAFLAGTVYFRRGGKSVTGSSAELRKALESQLESVRKGWLADVQKVVKAPAGSKIAVLPPTIQHADSPDALPIQIIDDPNAPTYRVVDIDRTHPFRAKEAIMEIAKRLPEDVVFNSFDFLSLRKVHDIDDREEFTHEPKFGSRQYSQGFVDWVVREYNKDHTFLTKARKKYREISG
ncbi:MAG: putative DNA binding domain-containing protein [Gammaproteobacteria bacterium]|nr:putative DNA binding domain-containing protein [Gammaproteobacteria bacterium]MDH3412460.1 putative DNA binding domain-containing protein [Gammaproteobacteria bacterium]